MRVSASFSIGAALTLLAWPTQAGFETGNDMAEFCATGAGTYNSTKCVAYIIGVFDMIELSQSLVDREGKQAPQYVCLPSGVSNFQIRDVVVKAVTDNPSQRHNGAAMLIFNALIKAFPCNQ